ncbi:hypothetical protein MRX96_028450 [Rhipicephalus microplus]
MTIFLRDKDDDRLADEVLCLFADVLRILRLPFSRFLAPRSPDRRPRAPGVGSQSVCGGAMTLEVTVNGTDADPSESESSDWVAKVSKRVALLQESEQRECDGATRAASTSGGCEKKAGRCQPATNGTSLV